ncbi:MAG: copper-translocating P-type ATPase [Candidatus Lokiarchaeota archaeon]|nr:copper-translocating P-type ATPase [Candidatus Lokiarchaeota archaeon]
MSKDTKKENNTRVNLNISGMTCAACALKISDKLNSLKGVKDAEVILTTESATLEIDESQIELDDILQSVKSIGYRANLSRTTFQLEQPISEEVHQNIIDILEGLHGTKKIQFNEGNRVSVTFNSGNISENQILRLLKDTGFQVKKSKGKLEEEQDLFNKEIQHRKRLLYTSLTLALPVVILTQLNRYTSLFANFEMGLLYILFGLSTITQLLVGSYFYKNAWRALRNFTANMDTLIAIGSGTAYIYSLLTTFFIEGKEFFEASVLIFSFILLGKFFEMLAKGRTSKALTKLMELQSSQASVIRNGEEELVDIDEIDVDDIVIIRPGESVPIDGRVTEGKTRIDESMLTGETYAVKKEPGDIVIGGTVNQNGVIKAKVERIGNDTVLQRIIELVRSAQSQKAPLQRIADKMSRIFVPIVISLALLTFLYWFFLANFTFEESLLRFVAVVVISCACAMGLAIPTAVMVGTGVGAKSGILIKGGESLEAIHKIKKIVFDKTGTLTVGKPQVIDIVPNKNHSEIEILSIAASVERGSEHPLANAIVEKAREQEIPLKPIADFMNHPGFGVEAILEGVNILIGNPSFANERNIDIQSQIEMISLFQNQGKTVVLVMNTTDLIGFITISDEIKPYAKSVINRLYEMDIEPYILTGDNEKTAKAIANRLGISKYFSEVLPAQKLEIIASLKNKGDGMVAMVGDGINDAPALSKADVGIAIGSGTDIAIESADIVLIRGDLRTILAALHLSKKTYNKMLQNLFWAFIYNIIGIPFAAGLFYYLGVPFLPPSIASLFMAFSSVSVVVSALLLYRVNLQKIIDEIKKDVEEEESIEKSSKEKGDEEIMASKLVCEECGYEEALPKHCGRDMIPRDGKLVCWMNLPKEEGGMGIQCGEQPISEHHGIPMKVV